MENEIGNCHFRVQGLGALEGRVCALLVPLLAAHGAQMEMQGYTEVIKVIH